ncbi:hypothetical protein ABMA32_19880 [Mesorhizobium sp. VNQ89]|uniref:hypothetical protein n=1 Tax=Mesorhizobium quangtriensis TaxID=3157709 RepID=UPI0032B83A20
MTALALSDVLMDFGTRPKAAASPILRPEPAPPPAPTTEEIVAAAVADAEHATAERLALAHAAEIEEMRQAHASEMDAVLRQIGQAAGETIAQRLDRMQETVSQEASETVARILGSFMSDELQKRSIESLAASIRAAVAGRETFRIEIRGPQSLYEALQAALGERAANFSFVELPGFDLSVTVDGTLFETRLSEWASILAEILE